MMLKNWLTILSAAALVMSLGSCRCSGGAVEKKAAESDRPVAVASPENNQEVPDEEPGYRDFPGIEVPSVFAEDNQGLIRYLLEHYWDNYLDTTKACLPDDSLTIRGVPTEQLVGVFGEYSSIINAAIDGQEAFKANYDAVRSSLDSFLDRASKISLKDTTSKLFMWGLNQLTYYLYSPISSARNEDAYACVASFMKNCEAFPEVIRGRYAFEENICRLNMTSSVANDFVYELPSGERGRMHDIQAEYTLLFFSNPGCHTCQGIIEMLENTDFGFARETISDLIAKRKLAVLNVYIDSDMKAWRDYVDQYPDDWINAFDAEKVIGQNTIYAIRAVPSLYLLDSQKRVIYKDAIPDKIVAFFNQNL